jgi:addiction module HigA family antidote
MYDGLTMGKPIGSGTGKSGTGAGAGASAAGGSLSTTVRRRPPSVVPMAGSSAAPRLTARRVPPHPGHFLETRFIKPLGITQQSLALLLGVSRRRVNELIRGHRSITADTAVRLALFFGNEASFWMQLQTDWDLHHAQNALRLRDGATIPRARKAE